MFSREYSTEHLRHIRVQINDDQSVPDRSIASCRSKVPSQICNIAILQMEADIRSLARVDEFVSDDVSNIASPKHQSGISSNLQIS